MWSPSVYDQPPHARGLHWLSSVVALTLTLYGVRGLQAEVTLTAANNTAYTLDDTGSGALTAPSVWGGWPRLCVRTQCVGSACAPCGALDILDAGGQASVIELGGRQRKLATQSLHGLEVTRRVFVPSDGQPEGDGFARFYDTIHNPGVTPVTFSVRLGSVEGQGGLGATESRVWRTSSYDATLSIQDRWLLIDDNDANAGDETIAVLYAGAGGRAPARVHFAPSPGGLRQELYWDYDEITVAPHASVSIMTVVVTEQVREDGLNEVSSLLRFRLTDVGFGLTEDERARVLNVDLNPFNASPLADLSGPYSVLEGEPLQVSALDSYDPEGFPLTYEWDFDQDGVFGEEGLESEGANVVLNFDQDGEYPIALRVTDHQQKFDVDRVMVQVRNGAPLIVAVPNSSPIYEGERLSVSVDASDPGPLDVLSYAFDWEVTGSYEPADGPDASHVYPHDGVYTATARVRDQDGGESFLPFTVEVLNAPPVIQQVVANNPSVEGAEVTFAVNASDPGGDLLLYEFDFNGDGQFDRSSSQGTITERFTDDGVYQVMVRVSDDQGASDEVAYTLTILNLSPIIHGVSVSANPQEGQVTTLNVVATDQGINDQLLYEFDLDGLPGYEVSQPTPTLEHVFQDNVRREISVRVTDESGGSTVNRQFVEVSNRPPTGELHFEGSGVREGVVATVDQDISFEGVVVATDPSPIDAESLSYFWDLDNDGVYERSSAGARISLRFPEEGSYVVRCLVRDKDLGELLLTREVSVAGRPPVLSSVELLDPPPYQEGQPVRFKVNATDPDPILYLFDFDGDGEFEVESTESVVRYPFPDEGLYEVRARAQDSSGFVESSVSLQVSNVPPSAEIDTGAVVGEGEDLEITITARDPGLEDLVILTVNLQGQEQQIELMPNESRRFTLPTQDNGLISVVVNARDEDGGVATEASALALIQNRPPFLPPFTPAPAREGEPYQQVIPADDPAGLNDSLFFSLINPPIGVEIEERSGLLLWSPTYDDYLNSPIIFQLVIEDEDGGRLERDLSIEVLPRDEDADGIPDTYERATCERFSPCLDPTNPEDATLDTDRDGRGALEEWRAGSDPFTYEGPEVPRPLSPVSDEQVRSSTVSLVVSFVDSDRPLPLDALGELTAREVSLQYELYSDEALSSLVADSGWRAQRAVSEGELNEWLVDVALLEDQTYWWRARAQDGPSVSPWSTVERFRMNAENYPPLAPRLSLPEDGNVVSDLKPVLTFYPSSDPDGDALYYVLRLYREGPMGAIPDGGGLVEAQPGDSMSALTFRPANSLQENARYQWDVVAVDEDGLESPASERWGFTVDLENEAPSAPVIYAPLPDSSVDRLRPIIQAGGSVDQEGAPVVYHFEVRSYGASEPTAVSPEEGVPARGGLAEWIPDVELAEDLKHVVSVYTSDGQSNSGLVTTSFSVSAQDNAPSVPLLLEPEDGAFIPADRAILLWGRSIDPEGGDVRYQVQLCDQRAQCQVSELLSERSFDIEGLIPAQEVHLWRVTAFDEANNTLGPSLVRRLAIAGGGQAQGGGCATNQGHGSSIILLTLLCLLLGRARKRA